MKSNELVDQNDHELVLLVRNGQVSAFDELLSRHEARTYKLALLLTTNSALAEEALSRTFADLYEEISSSNEDLVVEIVCISAVIRHARELKSHSCLRNEGNDSLEKTHQGELFFFESQADSSPIHSWQGSRLRSQLKYTLPSIPEDYRLAILMHDVIGMSKIVIAQAMKRPIAEIRQILNRSRLLTRTILKTPEAFPINLPPPGAVASRSSRPYDA